MTMTNLALQAGYPNYRAGNVRYGRLARDLGLELGMAMEDLPLTRLNLICEFIKPKSQTNREYLIAMRPNFAAALEMSKILA